MKYSVGEPGQGPASPEINSLKHSNLESGPEGQELGLRQLGGVLRLCTGTGAVGPL